MRKQFLLFALIIGFIGNHANAQTKTKDVAVGHVFHITLPEYMSRTVSLNDAAIYQYKSVVKDVYGFIIEDNKEELKLAEMNYSSINEFYEDFIKDFLVDLPKRTISDAKTKTIGDIKYLECDASYYDEEAQIEIYYLVGVVETKTSFYKVLSWAAAENKDKFKADFQSILYSLKD